VPAGAVVRVRGSEGQVVGGGFLVGPGVVATCAHVVADAVGADAYDPTAPTVGVRIDFPLLDGERAADDGGEPPGAVGRVERWLPIADDGTGDVALLRLDGALPTRARMPPLRRIERLWGHRFRALGFPDGAWDGVWTTGEIRGEQGTGWFQLQGTIGEQPIEGGFSGTPVWHDASGAVVGMTVAADRGGTTTAYLVPIDEVLGVDPELLPCPYRGLAPFGEEHADLFFGRGPDIERLVDAVDRHRVVAVAGPSGAGKSSLVRAGLLPRLRARGLHIAEVTAAPGAVPELPEVVPAPTVLLVDQFEELAALDPRAARLLLRDLVARADPDHEPDHEPGRGADVRVVLTVRWSALDDLLTPDLAAVLEAGTVLVAPLDRARLRETIVGPAERAPGLAFEDGLVDRILDDAGSEPGQLPLVESLLAALWEHRDGGHLTLDGYAQAGGVAGSVARHAEQVVAALGADEDALRRLFTRLARPDRDGRFVRHPVALSDLPEQLARLVPALAAGRLVVVGRSGTSGGQDTVELAHQALVEHWPRLREWLVADREFLAWRTALDVQRERWEAAGRDQGALLRGAALAAAAEWLPGRSADVSPAARDYLQRSTQLQRREVRRWRTVTAVLAVLVLAAGGLAVVVTQRGNELAAQLASANADTLGRESSARAPIDAVQAAQLALAAWHADPRNPQGRTALSRSYLALQSAEAVFPDVTGGPVTSIRPAGDRVLLLRQDAGPLVLDGLVGARTGTALGRWEPPEMTAATPFTMTRDARLLAAAGPDGGVRVWDVAAREIVRTLPATGQVLAVAFAPAGDRLGWLADTGDPTALELTVVDTATGRPLPHGLGPVPAGRLSAFWLPPDPATVLLRYGPTAPDSSFAAEPEDRLLRRSLVDGAQIEQLPPQVMVLGGGAELLSCRQVTSADGFHRAEVTAGPTGGGAEPVTITARGFTSDCGYLELTGDGGLLLQRYVSGQDRDQDIARVLDPTDGRVYQVTLPGPGELSVTGDRVRLDMSTAALRPPGEPPRLLMVHGTSLLVLRTDPAPAPAAPRERWRGESTDGRYTVRRIGDDFVVADATTGEVLGSRTFAPHPVLDMAWMVQDALWTLVLPAEGWWRLTRSELPDLAETYTIELPYAAADGTRRGPAVARDSAGGPVLTVSQGLLTGWDAHTGQRIGGPTDVGVPPLSAELYQDPSVLRPGHDTQMAVAAPDGSIQIWDALTGVRVGSIPTAGAGRGEIVFDLAGERLAVLTPQRTVEVWDVGTRSLVRPPIPVDTATALVGFDREGYLAVAVGGDERVDLFDVERGIVSGSLGFPIGMDDDVVDGRTMATDTTRVVDMPLEVPVTAAEWAARLCAVADRPFTAGELGILPAGADTDRPCS
jgi:hypothetical protein